MRVIGVDPGVYKTGIGIVEKENGKLVPVFFETFTLPSNVARHQKLLKIHEKLIGVISEFSPDIMAMEDIFYSHNFKAAIRLGEARSAAMLAATKSGTAIFEYLPTRVKESVCGNGRAAKQQVQHMVKSLLSLAELPEEDAADALAVAICHFHSKKQIVGIKGV